MTTHSHHDNVEKQFGSQAKAYLTSAVHASGRNLDRLSKRLEAFPQAHVLDLGCGAGHASFVAAQQVNQVTAYDLSSQMLEVVSHAAREKGLNNVTTRQGYAESLPFADESFDVVISRYSAHHWHDVGQALRMSNACSNQAGFSSSWISCRQDTRYEMYGCRQSKRCAIPRMSATIPVGSGSR